VDSRSDVYGAGAVMYETATGRRPWPEAQGARLIDAILHLPPLLPRELNPRLSPGLEAVILKSLDKDPERRYQSCRELLVDLERLSLPFAISGAHPRAPRRTTWAATVAAGALLAVLAGSGPGGARARLATEPEAIRSLVVLPIENRSPDAGQEYFSDGMTDALIAELGQVSSLRVISRTSSMQYKGARRPLPEIARELGVDAVLEGSVLREGDRVRITTELVHAPSDRQLWARTYERELRDVITLQREVAGSVVQEVRAQLTEQEKSRLATPRPVNPEAYEACLKGRHFIHSGNEASLRRAVEHFQRAAELDPLEPAAYTGLADAQTLLTVLLADGYKSSPEDALARVKALYDQALGLDANLPGAHAGLAFASFLFARDWPASDRGFARALELNPSLAEAHELHAWELTARGRLEEALVEMKRARELDPLSPLITAAVARVFLCKHQVPEAIAQYEKSLELKQDFLPGHYGLGMAYMVDGRHQQAIEQFKQAHALSEQSPPIVADLAHAYALAGQRKAALAELERWQRLTAHGYRPYEQAAHVYGALGDTTEAFASLEKAMASRSYGLVWLKVDPRFDPLRSDPRFKDLLNRLGLTS
jgi:TolB-like protein/Flp pilus assembly protein TadD